MRRCVRGESTRRLLELTLATGSVSPFCMEPADRDVDEALQEVTLCGRRVAPLTLELLVCVEVLAGTDQLESAFEPHRTIIGVREEC